MPTYSEVLAAKTAHKEEINTPPNKSDLAKTSEYANAAIKGDKPSQIVNNK
ncbi:MAG: hypothetical protein HOO90_10365 [Methylotenera sp.]|uniref:hypothetical protein n=1 Tax=Methylotenera sp. TaxID=2051956 RepID=UPI0018572D66|nr:hypothetical protein [Methylotenera sp.]NOU25920.1 hypothetical protein [Methylotenera sp.]